MDWLDLPKPWLFLAPMAGVGDWAFREVCYRFGAEIAVSHLVPVAGLILSPKKVMAEIKSSHAGRRFIVQLVGNRPADFEAAARVVTAHLPIAGIDINMGCPVAPVVGAGSGSALLREPQRAAAIVAAACAGTHLPVSVKLRTGWDSPVAPEIAPLLEAAGASALTVHGRTRAQHYRGSVDRDVIAAVKAAVRIPVVGNGGIDSLASALDMLATGVDGIMVGRGALGRPWLFAQLQAAVKSDNRYSLPPPRLGDVVREHVRLSFADLGPRRAPLAIRKHLSAYSNGSPYSASLRKTLETLRTLTDIDAWIAKLESTTTIDS